MVAKIIAVLELEGDNSNRNIIREFKMEVSNSYRPNVAAIVLSSDYPEKRKFMIARRKGMRQGWQFPQGGIDEGETPKEALFRELKEEIGTNEVEIIAEYPEWISYDFPKHTRNLRKYPFKGQKQKYFLVRLKPNASIDLDYFVTPEFEEYTFIDKEELFSKITFFKRRVYREVIDYFTKEGFL
jgi:putative (di)nucleoside polyphosphate hydrolase